MSPLSSARLLTIALLSALAIACGDDDDSAPSGQGGAGSSGTSGQSGTAGTSSQGGAGSAGASSGAGGTISAGASGDGGAAGSGTAGTSGGAGSGGAGAGGAGAAGSGGAGAGAGGAGAGGAAGGSSGASGQSGAAGSTSGAKVVSTLDVLVPRTGGGTWPHRVDIHAASDAVRGAVLLHGGGGHKEDFARGIGIVSDAGKVDAAWLLAHRLVVAMPQGQEVPPDGVPTWTNGVMLSGQDDQAFLTDLAAALRAGTLAPAVGRVYIAGHSNGGMMSNWMWCHAPATFDAYGALAGPAARRLDPAGTAPCVPSVVRPYLGIVGSADDVLRTEGNWQELYWTIAPALTKKTISWDNPDLVNEERFHTKVRVPAVCQGTATAPVDAGATTTWSDCNGQVRLIRVNGANHPMSSLESVSGLVLKDQLLSFFEASEP